MSAWTDAYAVEGTDFGVVDASHPNAIGHRGGDWKLKGGSLVPAFVRSKVIASNLFSPILGWCCTVQLLEGPYAGWYFHWAHLRGGTRPNNGVILSPGDQVGLAASGPLTGARTLLNAPVDYPGTAWTGPHIHGVLSKTIDGIFIGPTIDPRPAVYAATRSLAPAGDGTFTAVKRPTTPIAPAEEDDMFSDADRAMLADIQKVLGPEGGYRRTHGRLLDQGDLGTILKMQGAPHPDRSDYGRLIDLGDLATLLNAFAKVVGVHLTEQDKADIAAAVAVDVKPVDIDELVARIAASDDDEHQQILAAVAKAGDATLAAFGLKRA